jgi:FMN phosphatase YigB (HAD superfamily)
MSKSQLKHCRVFVFDLDGTVYEEVTHFDVFGEEIAKRLPENQREAFLTEAKQALQGEHVLKYGVTYDPVRDLIFKDGRATTWRGEPVPHEVQPVHEADSLMHVDDPWGMYSAMAKHFGLSQDALQAAFLATRAHMESADFAMVGLPGLRNAIDELRDLGRNVVLATNSPEPDSRAILEKLGLTGAFDEVIFEAKKPVRVLEHFRHFHEKFGVPYAEMVSIGDHYRNEIEPAHAIGMKTVYIDRYLRCKRPDVTVQLQHPKEIAGLLQDVVAEIRNETIS